MDAPTATSSAAVAILSSRTARRNSGLVDFSGVQKLLMLFQSGVFMRTPTQQPRRRQRSR